MPEGESTSVPSDSGRSSWATAAGSLPRAYIVAAFANFAIGVFLGVSMATVPALWPLLSSVHGELNPFGWLTILIYGMTYAVLTLFANLRPPWPVIGWAQLFVAELGVVLIGLAPLVASHELTRIGLFFQALAPVVFTFNIATAVVARHGKKGGHAALAGIRESDWPHELDRRFFGRSQELRETDRIAQRGTMIALLIYLFASVWVFIHALDPAVTAYTIHGKDRMLVYYGWILGTVLAVALHLIPRFADRTVVGPRQAQLGQALWVTGLALIALSPWPSFVAELGVRILGVAVVFHAALYLPGLKQAVKGLPRAVSLCWHGGWGFAAILGALLAIGLDPLSLAALHMLFLGWITSLVYGVGYTFFPFILHRRALSERLSYWQGIVSLLGAGTMAVSFLWLDARESDRTALGLLALGGSLAALGAWYFLIQWPLARRSA